MLECHQTLCLGYTPQELFDLVADVASYPLFLPGCYSAHILERSGKEMVADLTVGRGPLQGTFRSRVHLFPPYKIDVAYVNGPLKTLTNQWLFQGLSGGDEGCRVDCTLAFSFHNPLFNQMMSIFLTAAVTKVLGAFQARAEEVYGKRTPVPTQRVAP